MPLCCRGRGTRAAARAPPWMRGRGTLFAYLAKRLLFMLPLLLGITLISFAVIHLAPGSTVDLETSMNPRVSAEARERLRHLYGLDQPLHVQYGRWLKRLATMDLGESFAPDHRPVKDK